MVSPFAAHQQQLALMSQQQALLMAALKAGNAPQMMIPGTANQLNANGTLPFQNWTNLYQNPGSTPAAAQNGATKVKGLEDFRCIFLA
jgi:stromal membrane-associated protein